MAVSTNHVCGLLGPEPNRVSPEARRWTLRCVSLGKRVGAGGGTGCCGVLSNISSITDLGGFDPVWLFLVVGGVMFILGFAGCIGALRENTFLLKFFSVFLGIIFFLELTAGVLAFVFKDWIKDQLYFFINNNIRAYRDDIDLQNLIDFTQEYWQCCGAFGADDWNLNIYFNCTDSNASRERCGVPFSCCTKDPAWQCCGAFGADDWNLNIYFNCTDSNASRERCGVPFSCCTKDPAEDVINTQCGYDARQKPEVDQQIVIYTKGCVPQFEKWLQDNLTIVAGIFIGIALLQIFGICLAQNLRKGLEDEGFSGLPSSADHTKQQLAGGGIATAEMKRSAARGTSLGFRRRAHVRHALPRTQPAAPARVGQALTYSNSTQPYLEPRKAAAVLKTLEVQ
ncbi:Tetraspanin-5 [Tupaia chinensis]|uniref:Tetraspanin-5 n=1 Tax=Tupaia chinensis TaxID=246437 RepID=L9KKV0_TUPCH|nr:Tetraspanin-5 [Tupaia chinensis]